MKLLFPSHIFKLFIGRAWNKFEDKAYFHMWDFQITVIFHVTFMTVKLILLSLIGI